MRRIAALFLIAYSMQFATLRADVTVIERPFMEGRYDRAAYEAERMIDAGARQRYEIYYLKGLSELKLRRFKEARDSFGAIISKYAGSDRVFDAYIGIGDSYLLEGKAEDAASIYREVKEKFPNDRNIAIVEERLKDCRKDTAAILAPAATVNKANAIEESSSPVSVQAGCFKNKSNADALVTKLIVGGYQGYVELPVNTGDKLYRVKIGHPKSRTEAETIAARLNRDGYKTNICD